jgi:ATP-dependent 26S proteasome regulatory subunit
MAEDTFAVARRGLPAFVFVDETGAVVGQSSGGVDSVREIQDLVAEHLGIDL